MSDGQPKAPIRFHGAVPGLRMRNLAASVDHYVNVLGFAVDWQYEGIMASVSRGGASLMLCEGDQGNPGTWVWIGVGDAGRLHEECVKAGATIRLAPTNHSRAYEMNVEDPDGHVLRLGSDPRQYLPIVDGVMWYTGNPR